jgi:flavodoxin
MGEYGCRGYNTYGPWKVIGGMNKNHPSQEELEEAIHFYESLLNKKCCP